MKALVVVLAIVLTCANAHADNVGFDQAVSRILERSTSIPIQQAQLDVTRARSIPSYFVFAPGLSLDARRTWTGGLVPTTPYRTYEAVTDLNLFRFGADYFGLQAARSDIRSQEALLENTVLQAEEEAVRTLSAFVERKQSTQINLLYVKTQEDLLRIAKERYKAGYLAQQEVDKVSIDLENERSRLADAQVLEAQAEADLIALLGDANVETNWPWVGSLSAPDGTALSAEQFALGNRPDWMSALANVDAESRRSTRNHLLLLPSVDATFAYGNTTYLGNDGQILGGGGAAWQATLTATWSIWDHGATYSNARAQAFVSTQAETRKEQVARSALSDWSSAKASFQIAVNSAISRQKSAETARKLYEDSLLRFRKGRADANELSVDQTRLFQNELFAVQGWSTAHQAYSRLCHALGRRLRDCKTGK